jgi:hypothetical protein
MTANRTPDIEVDSKLILELKINPNGEVTRKASKLGRKDTLEGKLLSQIYPGIRVARVSVPSELTPYEQSVVENRMAQLIFGGVEYKLVGASGSAKEGKFYFVSQAYAKPIVERFQHWPEAAIVYFSILVSDCKLVSVEPNLNVVVVQDHVLGTNDCRGWISEPTVGGAGLEKLSTANLAFVRTDAANSGDRSTRSNRNKPKAHSRR